MTSINSNSASFVAQTGLNQASEDAAASIYRLSTGNAIYHSSDDLVASAIGRQLETNLSAYQAISNNVTQASSLLSVADSSANNILSILQQQISLANQSVTAPDDTSRRSLDMQFQYLTQEIDTIANNANFNQIKLFDGSLYNNANISTDTSLNLKSGSLTLTAIDLTSGKTLTVNGVTFTSGTNFTAAASTSLADTTSALGSLVTALQSSTDAHLAEADYMIGSGVPSLTITSNINGSSGNMFTVGSSTDTALFSGWYTPNVGGTAGNYRTLSSPNMQANGLSNLNTSVSGNVSDNILVGLSGTKATGSIDLSTFNTTTAASPTSLNSIASANFVSGPLGSNYAKITLSGHGFNTGDQLTSAAALSFDGLSFGINKNYTVTVIDKNTFQLAASSGSATVGNTAIGSATTLSLPNQIININGSTVAFASTPSASNQVAIGTTVAQTVQNLVNYLNSSEDANIAVANYSVNAAGTGVNITYKANTDAGNNYFITSASTLSASPLIGFTGLSASKNLQNGLWHGVDTSGVTNNPNFIGNISGFQGSYSGAPNSVNLSITIGAYTYSAQNVSTNANGSAQKVAFVSDTVNGANGGIFNIEFASTAGTSVNGTSDAQAFATRLNAAFTGLDFLQTRTINSYTSSGQIFNGSAVIGNTDNSLFQLTTDNFAELEIESVSFQSPSGPSQPGRMSITIDGEVFSNSSIASGIINNAQTVTLTSQNNANKTINFYNNSGNNQDFSSQQNATLLSTQFQNAFGLNQGKTNLVFQLGIDGQKASGMTISLESATSASLYGNNSLDISSLTTSTNASTILSGALDKMNQIMAQIGASQSRLNFASDNISSTIQNLQSAKSMFTDTDIAQESTNLAIAQVKIQVNISMLTQSNNMIRNLLKLFD